MLEYSKIIGIILRLIKNNIQIFAVMRYADFGDYFAHYMKNRFPGYSQKELATMFGTSQGNISKIIRGVALPSQELIATIKEKAGIDFTDAVLRSSEKYKEVSIALKQAVTQEQDKDTRPRLPISAAAGQLSAYLVGVMRSECEELPLIRNFPDYDFTMFIKGNSMEPKYESGDEIALKKATIIEWGKDYVLATEDGAIFKKIYEDGDNIRCVSYNSNEYPDFLVPKSAIYGFYRFVGLIRI